MKPGDLKNFGKIFCHSSMLTVDQEQLLLVHT